MAANAGRMVVVPPGGGEVVADAPDRRVELLSDVPSLHVTWSRLGPGRDGAEPHVHHQHADLFYVLDGTFTLRLGPGDEQVAAGAGTLVYLPPGVVHGFRNASRAETRYLNLHAPGVGFADYMRALRDRREFAYDQFDPPADGGRSPDDAVIVRAALEREGVRVAEVVLAPGGGADGQRAAELRSLYVLDGAVSVEAGGDRRDAAAGTWLQVPAGVEHRLAAVRPEGARLLEIRTPS